MAVHGGMTSPSASAPNAAMPSTTQSEALFARARTVMPGGVSSPVRAFRSVGGTPRFITRAEGPYFWDADDKRYIDYIGSWGPAIVGHAHPEVIRVVRNLAVVLPFGIKYLWPVRSTGTNQPVTRLPPLHRRSAT